MLALQS